MDADAMARLAQRMASTDIDTQARSAALLAAAAFVDELILPKQNERGYRDGLWVDPGQRIDRIIQVADWLLHRPGKLRAPAVSWDEPPGHGEPT